MQAFVPLPQDKDKEEEEKDGEDNNKVGATFQALINCYSDVKDVLQSLTSFTAPEFHKI